MALTYKVVNGSAPNASTETTVYTCPANTVAIVTMITFLNNDASVAANVFLWICPGGGATSDADRVFGMSSLLSVNQWGNVLPYQPAGGSGLIPVRWHMAAGDTLVWKFTGAGNNKVSFRPTILEVT